MGFTMEGDVFPKLGFKGKLALGIFIVVLGTPVTAEDMTDCLAGWDAYEQQNYMRSAELTSRCIAEGELGQATLARAWRNLGLALQSARHAAKAIEAYDIAISLKPGDVWNDHVNRGNALSDIGKYEEALQSYDNASQLTTDLGEVHYNRGIVFERMNDMPKAKEMFLLAFDSGLRSEGLAERVIVHGLYEKVEDRW